MPIRVSFGNYLTTSSASGIFLKLDASNDPVTNELNINPSSDAYSLRLQQDARLKSGKRLYLDGA